MQFTTVMNYTRVVKGRAEADNNKKKLTMSILKRVQQLVGTLEKGEMSEETMKERFEESWKSWIKELMATIKPLPEPPIEYEVEESVTEFFKQQSLTKFMAEHCTNTSLLSVGQHFGLAIEEYHIKVINRENGQQEQFEQYKQVAQDHTNELFAAVSRYLAKKQGSGENFKPLLTTELLRFTKDNIKQEIEIQGVSIFFTEVYYIDIVCNMCSHALIIFKEMAQAFRKKFDPFEYVERELKPYFQKVFIDHYKDIKKEITAAEALCEQLKEPVSECIVSAVNSHIGDQMRETFPWIQTKPTLLAGIMLEIGEMFRNNPLEAFDRCKEYLTDAKSSLQYWLHFFTKVYCDDGAPSRICIIIQDKIKEIIKLLMEKAQHVTNSPSMQDTMFSVSDWLKQFHSEVGTTLNLPLGMLCVIGEGQEFPDVNFFMSEFEKRLEVLSNELTKLYSNKTYQELDITCHENLFEQVCGCTAQCPFCKAQCEDNNENHWSASDKSHKVKHHTQHRPQCLGNFRWAKDNTMMLEVCSSLVAGIVTFRSEKTEQEFQPYKKYALYYPDWSIVADKSLEASLYWKWLIGHYHREIERMFEYKETAVPQEWKDLKWQDVKLWLKTEYKV